MSALGEYYRSMGMAALEQARVGHESAAASQTGANAQMIGQQGQAALHRAQAGMVPVLGHAQAGMWGADAFKTAQEGQQVPLNAASMRAVNSSITRQNDAGAYLHTQEGDQVSRNAAANRALTEAQTGSESQRGIMFEQGNRWGQTGPGIGGSTGGGMPAPPPVIGETPSVAPPLSIGATPSVAPPPAIGATPSVPLPPSQALSYQGAPGGGVQSPFQGSGGPYDYSATPHYAEGVSSVGPALMGAPNPSFASAPPANNWSSAVATGGNHRLLQPPNAEEMRSTYGQMGLPQEQIDARTAGAPTLRDHSVQGWKSMGYSDAEANYFGDLQHGVPGGHGPLPNAGMPVYDRQEVVPQPRYDRGGNMYSSGTSHITAPGDGTVDTTKAKLANGEAVLNRGAAEHLGQPAIQALNAVGMLRMGMVPGQNTPPSKGGRDLYGDGAYDEPTRSFTGPGISTPNERGASGGKSPGYAKGVSKAGPRKAAPAKDDKSTPKADKAMGGKPSDTPPLDQIDPKMLAAAMQMGLMGQQGGGMPPPQGAPMGAPQQMPQGAPMGMM